MRTKSSKASTKTEEPVSNQVVLNLNLALKYTNDLKTLFPHVGWDSYRFPFIKQESKQIGFFFGKIAYRHAGSSNDFENENNKKQLMSLIMKVADLRMESYGSGLPLMRMIEENILAMSNDLKIGLVNSMSSSMELFQASSRQNVLILNYNHAKHMHLLLTIWQNSLDLVVDSYMVANRKAKTSSAGAANMRIYFFYQAMVDLALLSLKPDKIMTLTESENDKFQRDMSSASKMRIPFLFPQLMYNDELLLPMINSYFDYRQSRKELLKHVVAPGLISASCALDGILPMYRNPETKTTEVVVACFNMDRIKEATYSFFDSKHKPTAFFGETRENENQAYRYSLSGEPDMDICSMDIRVQLDGKVEPFHIMVPRKFLTGQVVLLALALNMSMWFVAIAEKANFHKLEDVQFALQMLHPTIGINTHLFNHGWLLQKLGTLVPNIIYETKSADEQQHRQELQDLISSLLNFMSLPEIKTEESASFCGQPSLFDYLLPMYEGVLEDMRPIFMEYFSIPSLHERPSLANPPLSKDVVAMANGWIHDPENVRAFDYDYSEITEDRVQHLTSEFMHSMTGFTQMDIDQFVNMQKYSL